MELPVVNNHSEQPQQTEVGSYFVSNYPPFSLWNRADVRHFQHKLLQQPTINPGTGKVSPLGLYLHIPFCRKRCRFCYFRVYTNVNAKAIERYVEALAKEVELISNYEVIGNRPLTFVYFGGGTPSYLSSKQLLSLREQLHRAVSWDHAQEVTFECEPGTLSQEKVQTLKEIGVTRVSLGVENFNDHILEENGRAHLSPEIFRAYDWIQAAGFKQVNIDLIAGMIGETDENWQACLEQALRLQPDNLTIYQMELPFNTLISKEMKEQGTVSPVADWNTKRRWVDQAFNLFQSQGYHISSANELVRNPETDHFIYRDQVWRGADLVAAGVASFGHLQGVHYQNLDQIDDYLTTVERGELPVNRALVPSAHQLMIREFVLQLKEGQLDTSLLERKYHVNILQEFAIPISNQQSKGYLTVDGSTIRLTRKGLLQVDTLLTEYFEPEHRSVRYT